MLGFAAKDGTGAPSTSVKKSDAAFVVDALCNT
jgi:hypothetical protein